MKHVGASAAPHNLCHWLQWLRKGMAASPIHLGSVWSPTHTACVQKNWSEQCRHGLWVGPTICPLNTGARRTLIHLGRWQPRTWPCAAMVGVAVAVRGRCLFPGSCHPPPLLLPTLSPLKDAVLPNLSSPLAVFFFLLLKWGFSSVLFFDYAKILHLLR